MEGNLQQYLFRITAYLLIGLSYLYYLAAFSPLGINWLDWHSTRIFNAVEFLKLNGYFSSFGFSIWSSCSDCSLELLSWKDKIYLSAPFFPLLPYILLNEIGGKDFLLAYGPELDKTIIMITGILIAELSIRIFRNLSKPSAFPSFLIGTAVFMLFITSPWVYKMFLASWAEVYFLFFLVSGLFLVHLNKNFLGLSCFFIAAIFHYIWSFFIGIFFLIIIFFPKLIGDKNNYNEYFPSNMHSSPYKKMIVAISFILPCIIYSWMKLMISYDLDGSDGSSVFFRIGVSGNDIHNGSLIGALQFLAGNRITSCISPDSSFMMGQGFNFAIFSFNCSLSIISMALLSVLSIIGISTLIFSSKVARSIFLPLAFAAFIFIMIFQQALSVHLMGYSYIFAFFFSVGIAALINYLSEKFSSLLLKIAFIAPLLLGVVITSTRVSLLTGING
jgi:hypothetical protein